MVLTDKPFVPGCIWIIWVQSVSDAQEFYVKNYRWRDFVEERRNVRSSQHLQCLGSAASLVDWETLIIVVHCRIQMILMTIWIVFSPDVLHWMATNVARLHLPICHSSWRFTIEYKDKDKEEGECVLSALAFVSWRLTALNLSSPMFVLYFCP